MRSRFEEVAGQLVGAVRAGATLEAAAAQASVSVHTVRCWARKGRGEPDGRYGQFAVDLAAARGRPARLESAEMDWSEFDAHLAKAVRTGSVQAMRLFASLHRPDGEPAAEGDEFARFDELATRRRVRGAA